jgi:hypothetical protein
MRHSALSNRGVLCSALKFHGGSGQGSISESDSGKI